MRIGLVATFLTAAAVLVATPASALDFLEGYCLLANQTDRVVIAAGRAACDETAQNQGYQHGVFRPATDEEQALFKPCEITTPQIFYSCLGTPSK